MVENTNFGDTSGPDMNVFIESCGTCKHGDINPPKNADWWVCCTINSKPMDGNVYKPCDKYEKHPHFEHCVM